MKKIIILLGLCMIILMSISVFAERDDMTGCSVDPLDYILYNTTIGDIGVSTTFASLDLNDTNGFTVFLEDWYWIGGYNDDYPQYGNYDGATRKLRISCPSVAWGACTANKWCWYSSVAETTLNTRLPLGDCGAETYYNFSMYSTNTTTFSFVDVFLNGVNLTTLSGSSYSTSNLDSLRLSESGQVFTMDGIYVWDGYDCPGSLPSCTNLTITATDVLDNSLVGFYANVTYNGSTTTWSDVAGTITTDICMEDQLLANIVWYNDSWYDHSVTDWNTSSAYAFTDLFQSVISFNVTEVVSLSDIDYYNLSYGDYSNISNSAVLDLYLLVGSYNFTFENVSYYNYTEEVELSYLDNLSYDVPLYSSVVFLSALDNNFTYISDVSAVITCSNYSSYSDSSSFLFGNDTFYLIDGDYTILLSSAGYYSNISEFVVSNSEEFYNFTLSLMPPSSGSFIFEGHPVPDAEDSQLFTPSLTESRLLSWVVIVLVVLGTLQNYKTRHYVRKKLRKRRKF